MQSPPSFSTQADSSGEQRFAHVVGMRQVEHRITDQDHQLFMISSKRTGKRMVTGFFNYAFSKPLPELLLRSPEFFSIPADHYRRFLLLFFLFLIFGHPVREPHLGRG